jgi:CRISPR/Cas system-associated exonuclease Cas4 (RecB family)
VSTIEIYGNPLCPSTWQVRATPPRPIPALSASQLKSFLLCPRKWAFDKIDKVPRPDTPSTALGTRVHTILEDWLRDGTPPDLSEVYTYENPRRPGEQVVRYPGRIAHAGLHLLPPPRAPGLEIEGWLSLRTRATVWSGRLDLRYTDPATGEAVVHDHKTTSSPAYAQTPETLRQDPQALLYAASEMVRLSVDRVRLDWLYLPTAGGKAWKVSLPVLRDEISPDLDRLEDTAVLIHRTIAAGLAARDVPGNPNACSAFGGCEYSLTCDKSTLPTIDPFQGFDDPMTHPTSPDALSAMDALMAKLSGGAPLPPPPPTDQINPPEAPPPSIAPPPLAPMPPAPVVTVPPGGYKSMERKDLKVLAVARGLIEDSSKLGKGSIVSLLEEQDGPVEAPSAPPAPPTPALPPEYGQTAHTEAPGAWTTPAMNAPAAPSAPPAPPPPAEVAAAAVRAMTQPAPAAPTPAPTAHASSAAPQAAPALTPAHRAFWSEAYLAAARNGHETPVAVADAALKALIGRFAGVA